MSTPGQLEAQDSTGFRQVPWEPAGGEDLSGFPPDERPDGCGPSCAAKWKNWACTLHLGHHGTHRAGTGRLILAEWYPAEYETGDDRLEIR